MNVKESVKINNKIFSIYSLRTQLVLFYTIISLVVLGIGSMLTYSYVFDVLEKQNEKLLIQQFKQSDYNINTAITYVDELSKLFIINEDIQNFLLDNYATNEFDVVETNMNIMAHISDYLNNYAYINSIYIYTENGGQIGASIKNSRIANAQDEDNLFFESELYNNAKASFPKLELGGGLDEMFFNPNITDNPEKLICITRSIKPISQPQRKATLVFNISESYISSIYSKTTDDLLGDIFIINKEGIIVSSRNEEEIGQLSSIHTMLNLDNREGSLTYEKNNDAMQLVYYNLEGTDWFLVGEMPLELAMEDITTLRNIIFIILLISMLTIFFVSYFLINKSLHPLNQLSRKMKDISRGKMGETLTHIPKNELGTVIKHFNRMSLNIAELIEKNEQIQDEKRKLEIEALQSQINPHFLYNTINMIRWMAAMIKADNIVKSVVALGNILKPLYKNTDVICTISEEIDFLKNYLIIMNIRFGNSIELEFNVPGSLENYIIPRFILQPVIENAVTHGIKKTGESIAIKVAIYSEKDDIILKVNDTGKGIDTYKLTRIQDSLKNKLDNDESKTGIGLHNVHRRITLNYGAPYGLEMESIENEGTTITIKVPAIQ